MNRNKASIAVIMVFCFILGVMAGGAMLNNVAQAEDGYMHLAPAPDLLPIFPATLTTKKFYETPKHGYVNVWALQSTKYKLHGEKAGQICGWYKFSHEMRFYEP